MRQVIFIIAVTFAILLFWTSQQRRLNAYSEWYCQEIYGLNPDCSGNYTKGGE